MGDPLSSEFAIRPMRAEDAPFLYRAWLEGFWPHSGGGLIMAKSDWLPRWHAVIERLLAGPGGVLVAHVDGRPDSLLGFAAAGAGCLHWAYVKQAFRGLGIATALIEKLHLNELVSSHWSPKLGEHGWRYDPTKLKGYT